ncbi:hypothetical protein BV454_03450 [Bacillus altitudinis]|uniref:hypothetical protein n=1 Tax=Bacillus TaxID=1386 RepID=UPI00094BD366|nr:MULTISPECIES: hypothetical protein [Bacillus]NQW96397.1 hypothetical protein [Bacillus stratosphericus]APT50451.1 hypothetical protein BSA41_11040 [Bacillus safensis]APT53272.1 hypothetical protein BSA171_06670 [Bacillus safensis]MCL4100105.1 hypothetical protein [Bacillus altitudinis]MDT1119089.1 hypothetical protein [Bacillus altitudinis]
MENVIAEKSDLLHDVIFEISESVQGIKFPVERVVDYLLEEGYIINNTETTKTVYILYKENKKTVVTSNFISFEKLGQNDRERYKQNFYTYVISRSKIYFQSAVQNVKAAKINLIQNQRRTCVSNMYYALHNSFASMVEFYKSEMLLNKQLIEDESNNDDETKLEHFVPKALQAFVTNIDDILTSENEEFIKNQKMNVGRVKSHENPFAWIFPLFINWIEDEKFVEIINSMNDALQNVNLENFGIDNTSRRSGFENQLKENLTIIREISKTEGSKTEKVLYMNMAAFLAYAYMLRQSADYDSLFEIKIPHQDIINWTIITASFLEFVTIFVREDNAQNNERIQKLDAASSTEILRTHDTDLRSTIMTMTGIIIDKEFELVQIIKRLYSQKGFRMVNQRGRIVELNDNTEIISICRILFGTPLECFISFSSQGLFRIDIVLKDEIADTEFSKGVNQYYLEQLIQTDILEKDLLTVVSKNATIVRGIPTTLQHSSLNYLDLVVGVHERLGRNIQVNLSRHLREASIKHSTEKIVIICLFSMNRNERDLIFRVRHVFDSNRYYRDITSEVKNGSVTKLLFIYLCPYSVQNKSELETKVAKYIDEKFPQLESKFEFIQMSESEVRQVIEKDYSFLDLVITNLKEKFEKVQSSEHFKTINFENSNVEYEINEEDLEDIVEDIDKSTILNKEEKESPVQVQ